LLRDIDGPRLPLLGEPSVPSAAIPRATRIVRASTSRSSHTKFELAINRKVASALGITIPYSILVRVDRLIE
jgi:hypothetical protein